jgi:L-ascorbate metabolism protein UlaG (beta-lactamase superfamily)
MSARAQGSAGSLGTAQPLAVTWAGHSTALIELDGMRLLTDPVLRERVGPLVRLARPVDSQVSERIDAILISHLHADHVDLRSLALLDRATPVLAPPGAGEWLGRQGMQDVREIGSGERVRVGAVEVCSTPATHDGRRWPRGASAEAIGFVVRGTQSCYFAGDTDLFAGMSSLTPIDLALLPVWGWGPTLGPGHLDPARAATAARMIAPRVAVPIHWGTFALGRPLRRPGDPQLPARRFAELTAREAPGVQVRTLAPGERTELRADELTAESV